MGLQTGGHQTLSAGTGTFGYEPNVNYLMGFPGSRTGSHGRGQVLQANILPYNPSFEWPYDG
jgi:hypothetical protein